MTDGINTPPQSFESCDESEVPFLITNARLNELVEAKFRTLQESASTSSKAAGNSENTDKVHKELMVNESKNYINHVSFKPPQPLFAQNPIIWFSILEQLFFSAKIKTECTKYSHAVAALDARLHNQFADLIIRDKGDIPYTIFKNEVTKVLSDTEKAKLNNILHNLSLGDKKPSQLLSEFRLNAGSSFNEKTIKQLWMKRLPQQVQMVLSAIENDVSLVVLAERADNLIETLSGCQINSINTASSTVNKVSKNDSTNISTNSSFAIEKYFDEKLSKFLKEISSIVINSRSRSNSRSNSRNSSRSPATRSLNPKHEQCWYHFKFGNKALKCVVGCKFYEQFSNQSGSKND